ncbi:MAG: SDR family oxidoreductase [Candidatus Baltobacteraceae bacterium]
MDLGIKGRVALVTGASSGIGRACALALAAEGVALAVAARRMPELKKVTEEALQAGAPSAAAFEVDLTDLPSIGQMLRDVRDQLGPPEILVANSGGPKPGKFLQTSHEDWDTAYRGVFQSMISLVNGVVPEMRARKWGRIVLLASSSVKTPIPTLVLSNAFRTALVSAMKTLSVEVASDGVTVNTIATGRIATDRLRQLYKTDDEWERAAQEVPMKRIASPNEFAPAIAFLSSQPASYITGQTLAVDGGLIDSLL